MPQQSSRGSRRYRRDDTIDPHLLAQVDLPTRTFKLTWVLDEGDAEAGLLLIPGPALRGMDLAALTVTELMHFKALMDLAFEQALPICQRRDAAAQHDFDHGLGLNKRLYRPPSQFLNFGTLEPTPNPTQGQDDVEQDDDRGVPQ